ncbi:MAG: phasin family protein [Planctomycetota bacterium]
MFETANKMFLAGLGALSMTRERAESIFEEYVRRGEAERGQQAGFVKDMMDTAEKARTDLEEIIGKQVRQVVTSMDLVTREDLARLEAKLDELVAKGFHTP